MKVSFLTLGCKVNQAETLEWERAVSRQGHQVVSLDDAPEICVVNTCTVTGRSDYESRRLIRQAQKTGAEVIATGCYSQLNANLVSKMPGVSGVIPNEEKDRIINILCTRSVAMPADLSSTGDSFFRFTAGTRTRKFLKIQDGCDHSCTYCLVWKARGKSRSVKPEEVIGQVNEALDSGYREIVLTGIHLGLYGKDLGSGYSLSSLITDIVKRTATPRLRVSSLEINEIDDELLHLIKKKHVCRHLHIPLQCGDDSVLSDMGRHYSTGLFRDNILKIKDILGDIALGTDIIAGFPTETEGSFQNSLELVRELPFTYLHVFPYSARPGTVASGLPDEVGGMERKRRASILREVSREKRTSYAKNQVGKTISVLVEECYDSGICQGTSDNYLKVSAPFRRGQRGNLVFIQVERASGGQLFGKLKESL